MLARLASSRERQLTDQEKEIRRYRYYRMSEFTISILCGWVMWGLILMGAGLTDDWSPTVSLSRLPNWIEFVTGTQIFAAGAMSMYGGIPKHQLENDRWAFEMSGMILGATGWFTMAVSGLFLDPTKPFFYVFGGWLVVASIWRAIRIYKYSKKTRQAKVEALMEAEYVD